MSISDLRESDSFDYYFDGAHTTLPFHELDDGAFNAHIGINKACGKPKMRGLSCILVSMNLQEPTEIRIGNYIAGYILAQHRIQAKQYQPRWRNLEGIFTLPMELLIQVAPPCFMLHATIHRPFGRRSSRHSIPSTCITSYSPRGD